MKSYDNIVIHEILSELRVSKFLGNKNAIINKLLPFNKDNKDNKTLSWVNAKNQFSVTGLNHGSIIISSDFDPSQCKEECNYIFVDNPRMAFSQVMRRFFMPPVASYSISKSAYIDSSSNLSSNVFIDHNVVIEANCKIGENVRISANTHIQENTVIGNNVNIGSNCSIGGVGFGYEKDESGQYVLLPHLGNVKIANNVEIGSNTCIDKAVLGSTIIGENVKIDNLVHIAHGVKIGENSLIIANAMIAGSSNIGRDVWVSPSSSIINGISLGDNSLIGMGAVVRKNVESEAVVVGNPAKVLKR